MDISSLKCYKALYISHLIFPFNSSKINGKRKNEWTNHTNYCHPVRRSTEVLRKEQQADIWDRRSRGLTKKLDSKKKKKLRRRKKLQTKTNAYLPLEFSFIGKWNETLVRGRGALVPAFWARRRLVSNQFHGRKMTSHYDLWIINERERFN